jgi:hypothetical protein
MTKLFMEVFGKIIEVFMVDFPTSHGADDTGGRDLWEIHR